MQRCVYAISSRPLNYIDEMMKLENDVQESRISPANFRKKLQEAVSDTKNEIAKHLMDLGVSTFSMAPVKRKYAFERFDIPGGENYVVKINYPFKDPALPIDLKGESFCALLGTRCSALELFLIKRKIMGPSWLQVSNFSTCSASQRVSWCKFEVTVASPKDIRVSSTPSKITFEIPPPVVVTAINLKTIINETVKLILSKENPPFVCDSRVLVKPYKEKGKVPDKKQQQMDRGDYSPCGTPIGLDARDQYDLQLDGRMFYNTQDMLWRRKLEEQADLRQALELQSRRLMGLQLLDIKNNTNVLFLLEVQFLLQLTLLICSTKILFFLPFTEAQNLLQKKMV